LTPAHAIGEADRNVQQAEQRTRLYRLVQRLEIIDEPKGGRLPGWKTFATGSSVLREFADPELVGDTASSGGREERLAAVDQRLCV
jgi:hypothetical protein